jgi:hypothetical protein
MMSHGTNDALGPPGPRTKPLERHRVPAVDRVHPEHRPRPPPSDSASPVSISQGPSHAFGPACGPPVQAVLKRLSPRVWLRRLLKILPIDPRVNRITFQLEISHSFSCDANRREK